MEKTISKISWIGKRFNCLTIIKEPIFCYVGKRKRWKVKCQCDCGNIKEIQLCKLKNNNAQSCGCLRKKLSAERFAKLNKKYTTNYNFFDNINNQENTYCLGLWCADGCNYLKKRKILIGMTDLDIIEKIKKALQYTGPIYKILPKKNTHKIEYRLGINSSKLCQDLIKWGCLPNKSYCLEFPKAKDVEGIPYHLMNHWIRGLFDGDGCLCKYKNGYWSVTIVGTKNICEGIKNYLKFGNVSINTKNSKTKHETWIWRTDSKNNIKNFLNYIYKDATIYLERKYQKYQEFL